MSSFLKNLNMGVWFRNKTFCLIFAILSAFAIWLFVVISVSPDIEMTIRDVPIKVTAPAGSELKAVEGTDVTATVKIKGKRYQIGSLGKNDIVVSANTDGVSSSRYYDLSLVVDDANANYTVLSVSPETIFVKFDKIVTKELTIEPQITGLRIPDGYIHNPDQDTVVTPGTVTLSGPENSVSKIVSAVVYCDLSDALYESQSSEQAIVFLDSAGNAVEDSLITVSATTAELNIKVNKIVELPLTLTYINVPTDFPLSEMSYTLSNPTITVAAEESVLKNYNELTLGYINFKQLDLTENSSLTFSVNLPSNFINVDNIETVIADFDVTDLTSTSLNLKEFTVVNVPAGYTATVTTTSLNNVKLVGSAADIKALSARDIVAKIDFADYDVQAGQIQLPVSIYAPTSGFVWAVGEYEVVVSIKEN